MSNSRQEIIYQVKGGTGSATLAPPWSREQVKWLGRGYYVLRLAGDEASRWFLGAAFRWGDVYPHEKTFRRSAADKGTLISSLKMNPWPVHLTADVDAQDWRQAFSSAVEGTAPVYDTGYVTLWRLSKLPTTMPPLGRLLVLDGHHSRRAQHHLGLRRMFGWVEPLQSPHLMVRSIERAGWLASWLDQCVEAGELRVLPHAPDPSEWSVEKSLAFEVVQAGKRWWAEVARPLKGEAVVDALTRLAKGKCFLRSSASFEEILGWLERFEIDTALRLPQPTKSYILARAVERRLFPQKSTYFYPKLPFGILVEDLR